MPNIVLPHSHHENENIEAFKIQLDKTKDFEVVSDIFKQLSDQTRLRIFWFLCHSEECVLNISYMVNMSSPAVSHHLKALKSSGLIESNRHGKEVYYKASNTTEAKILHDSIEELLNIKCPK